MPTGMATTTHALTIEEFRAQYQDKKPRYEYWFGEVVQKPVPTFLHSILVKLLLTALDNAGYESAPELELRIDPDWQPKPDVAAVSFVEQPYPTKPIDVVVEVLSPTDSMSGVFEKCRQYDRIGIKAIFVFDAEHHWAWVWERGNENLERISNMQLPNGSQIEVEALFLQLEKRLQHGRPA